MRTSSEPTALDTDKIIKTLEALPNRIILFTKEEDDLIKKYYPIKGMAIASVLGKTKNQIKTRVSKLGIKCARP